MTDAYWNYTTRKPRHRAAGSDGLRVEICRIATETAALVRAELVDLSREGLQLHTTMSLPDGEPIIVHIVDKPACIDLTMSAAVRWCRSEQEGRWLIGCQSDGPLPWETLGELFLGEILATDAHSVDRVVTDS